MGKHEPCECEDRGYLFPCNLDTGFACVEKCDLCEKFVYDDEAAATLGTELMKLDPRYAIVTMVLPDMEWEECGSTRFVVTKRANRAGGTICFEPICDTEAMHLAVKLGIVDDKPAPKCCPLCGGTSLDVQLPAVFRWDGEAYALGPDDLSSDEFPLDGEAVVVCNGHCDEETCQVCDWTGKVHELVDKE